MDDQGKRPGGLTALAVLNFVLGGLGVLSMLGLGALFALLGTDVGADDPELAQALEDMGGATGLALILAANLISTILIVVAGVGYLKQRRVMGRIVGNVYAITAIVSTLLSAVLLPAQTGGGAGLTTIISLIYPVLTLALINTTFKDDLVN